MKSVDVSENKIDDDLIFFIPCIIIYQINVSENVGKLQIGGQFRWLILSIENAYGTFFCAAVSRYSDCSYMFVSSYFL